MYPHPVFLCLIPNPYRVSFSQVEGGRVPENLAELVKNLRRSQHLITKDQSRTLPFIEKAEQGLAEVSLRRWFI